MELYKGNITEYFKMLYAACDIADEIKKKINQTNNTSDNSGTIAVEADKIQDVINELMIKRIRFIRFTAALTMDENKVLKLRCEDCLSWKNIAAEMHLGVTTIKALYKRVEAAAEQFEGLLS